MARSQLSENKQQKKKRVGSYIDDSLRNIQEGCYKNGKICLDGGYGDYRMSIFRLKDRKKQYHQIPTMFTQTFVKDIEKLTPELKEEFHKIIKAKN